MAIDKEHSPQWVKITVWVLVFTLVFVWLGAGIFSLFDKNNQPTTQTPVTQTAAQKVEAINAQYTAQVTTLEGVLKTKPEDKDTLVSLAQAYMDWGTNLMQSGDASATAGSGAKFASSVSIWEKAYKLDPASKEIGGDYATALFNVGQTDKAVELARKVLKANPEYATVWFNLGIYLSNTDIPGSIKAFETAIKYDKEGAYKTQAQKNIDLLKKQTTTK